MLMMLDVREREREMGVLVFECPVNCIGHIGVKGERGWQEPFPLVC